MKKLEYNNDIYTKLHQKYFDTLVKKCVIYVGHDSVLRHDAEDWVQEAFILAFRKRKHFLLSENKIGWLFKACKYYAMNAIKRKRTQHTHAPYRFDSEQATTIEKLFQETVDTWPDLDKYRVALQKTLEMLTDAEMAVFRDRYLNDMKIKDIAEKHNKTKGAIESYIQKIKTKALQNKNWIFLFYLVCFWKLRK